jgi:hypothetical protein
VFSFPTEDNLPTMKHFTFYVISLFAYLSPDITTRCRAYPFPVLLFPDFFTQAEIPLSALFTVKPEITPYRGCTVEEG